MGQMKTTVEITDALLERARKHAGETGQTVRGLIEEGLRRVLEAEPPAKPFHLPDRSVGRAGGVNPLEAMTWQDLRGAIYGEPEA
jgi:hypothetical protein